MIDVENIPVQKVGKIEMVYLDDIKNAKTYELKVQKVAPYDCIDIRWLQKRMVQGISEDERHLESSAFEIINSYIDEYKKGGNENV